MLIQQKIESIHLSSSQQIVADYLLEKRYIIKDITINELAKRTFTSPATIVRLSKKLGYDGYESLKKDFLQEVEYLDTHFENIDANYPFHQDDNIQRIASKITKLSKEALDDTLSLIEHDSLQQALQILRKTNIIHLEAISYPLLLGQMFQLNMQRLGKIVNINTINGEELFMPSLYSEQDCLIIISYSGQIDTMINLAKKAKKRNVKIIVITGLGDNELSKYADVILHISTREKLYSKVGGFVNETSIKLILDILYSCYFAFNYDDNLSKRIEISKDAEINRYATYEIMKED